MVSSFLKHIFLLVLINILIKGLYVFGIDRQVQLTVGTMSYGLYFALYNFTYLFQVINEFGIQNYNLQIIASKSRPHLFQLHAISYLKLYLHVIFIVLVGVGALVMGYGIHWRWLIFLVFNQVLISWISYLRTFYSGRGLYRQDTWISVMDKALVIIMVGAFLVTPFWRPHFSVDWFLALQSMSLVITVIVAHVWARDLNYHYWVKPSGFELRAVVADCIPFVITVLLMTLYSRLDAVMIERLLPVGGAEETGIYAAGFRLLDAINMVVFMSAIPILAVYARHTHDHTTLARLYRSALWLISLITMGAGLYLAAYAEVIMPWLYPVATPYWARVFQPIILTFIPTGLIMITSSLFTADRKLSKVNPYFFASIVVNIMLNWWLITQEKALGAAWATLMTQSFTALILIVLVRKQYQLAPYHDYLSLALSGLVLATMLWFLHQNALPSAWNHPVYGLLLTGIWALTLFFVHRRRILVWPKD